MVREHRGDSHVAASIAADLDAVRMNILSELWLGYPLGEYSGTRAWSQEATDAALARLEADGHIADGAITPEGRGFRDEIERATDVAQQPVVDALGGELDGLVEQLDAWSQVCVEAKAFPPDFRASRRVNVRGQRRSRMGRCATPAQS